MLRTILLTSLVALVSSQVTCGWCNDYPAMKDPRWVDGMYKGHFVTAVRCVDCALEKNHKACMDSGCLPGPGHKCTPDDEACGVDVGGEQGTCCPGSACYRFTPAGQGMGYICMPSRKTEVGGSVSSAQAAGILSDGNKSASTQCTLEGKDCEGLGPDTCCPGLKCGYVNRRGVICSPTQAESVDRNKTALGQCTLDHESCEVDVRGEQGTCCPGSGCYSLQPSHHGLGSICVRRPEVGGSISSSQAGGSLSAALLV